MQLEPVLFVSYVTLCIYHWLIQTLAKINCFAFPVLVIICVFVWDCAGYPNQSTE